jgi:hypothetical protein
MRLGRVRVRKGWRKVDGIYTISASFLAESSPRSGGTWWIPVINYMLIMAGRIKDK